MITQFSRSPYIHILWVSFLFGCSQSHEEPASAQAGGGSVVSESAETGVQRNSGESRTTDPAAVAFAQLVQAFLENDAEGWASAKQELTDLGQQAIPALASALESGNEQERELATIMLADMGPEALGAADALTKVLGDQSIVTRANAASILALHDDPAPSIVVVLRALLKEEPKWQEFALLTLANLGHRGASATPDVELLLASDNDRIRAAAAGALERLREPAPDISGETALTPAADSNVIATETGIEPYGAGQAEEGPALVLPDNLRPR